MKTLLITGGCGFIASNFINRFLERNPNQVLINLLQTICIIVQAKQM